MIAERDGEIHAYLRTVDRADGVILRLEEWIGGAVTRVADVTKTVVDRFTPEQVGFNHHVIQTATPRLLGELRIPNTTADE